MTIIYKEFLPEDVEVYFDSYVDTIQHLSETWEQSSWWMKQALQNIIDQWTIIYIAIDQELNEVVWSCSMMIEQKILRWYAKAWHLEDVVTRKGREGKGVASSLIKLCLVYAEKQWCYKVIGDCREELIPYYARFGLEKHEINIKKYF